MPFERPEFSLDEQEVVPGTPTLNKWEIGGAAQQDLLAKVGVPSRSALNQAPWFSELPDGQKVDAALRIFDTLYINNPDLVDLARNDPSSFQKLRQEYSGSTFRMGDPLVTAAVRGALTGVGLSGVANRIMPPESPVLTTPETIAGVAGEVAGMAGPFGALKKAQMALGATGAVAGLARTAATGAIYGYTTEKAKQQELVKDLAITSLQVDKREFFETPAAQKLASDLSTAPSREAAIKAAEFALFELGAKAAIGTAKGVFRAGKSLFEKHPPMSRDIIAGKVPSSLTTAEEGLAKVGPSLNPVDELAQETLLTESLRPVVTRGGNGPRIFLKDGREIVMDDMKNGFYRVIPRKGKYANIDAQKAAEVSRLRKQKFGIKDIGEIRGSLDEINEAISTMFGETGAAPFKLSELPDKYARAAGVEVQRIGGRYTVIHNSGKIVDFGFDKGAFQKYLDALPNGWQVRLEDPALAQISSADKAANVFGLRKDISDEIGKHLKQMADAHAGRPTGAVTPPRFQFEGPETLPERMAASAPWASPARIGLGRLVAPVEKTFLRTEKWSGLPVHSRLFRTVTEAKTASRRFHGEWQEKSKILRGFKEGSPQDQGYSHALSTVPGSADETRLIAEFKLNPTTLASLRDTTEELFQNLGIGSAADYFQKYIPHIQKARSLDKAFPDDTLMPPQVSYFAESLRRGRVNPWSDKPSARRLLMEHVEQGGSRKYLYPVVREEAKYWDKVLGDKEVSPALKVLVKNYLDDVVGNTTLQDLSVLEAIGVAGEKVRRSWRALRGVDPGDFDVTREEMLRNGRRFYGNMFTATYDGALGYRPASIARQHIQLMQTTTPRYGLKYVWGKGGGIARWNTKEGKALVEEAGSLLEETPYFYGEEGVLMRSGKGMRHADNVQRGVASLSADSAFVDNISVYLEQNDWSKFAHKSRINRLHPIIQGQLKEIIDSGDLHAARLRNMWEGSSKTQWLYDRSNRPHLFRGVGGRIFGQYGVWPSYYANYVLELFTPFLPGGGTSLERLAAGRELAMWAGTNAALAGAFQTVLGADATSWLFFHPIGFVGGPIFQTFNDTAQALTGIGLKKTAAGRSIFRSAIPELDAYIPKMRVPTAAPFVGGHEISLFPQVVGQFVPGLQAGRDLLGVLQAEDGWDAVRELLGYPEAEDIRRRRPSRPSRERR